MIGSHKMPGGFVKAYLLTTAVVFGLIIVAHIWRVAEEGRHLATEPSFLIATLVAAGFGVWAILLLRRLPR
jgi:hypothetical protein